jgi:isoquinoline 1-oxidoreductase beta subunit
MRGVKGVVKQDAFVAVVADNWWRANQARSSSRSSGTRAQRQGHDRVDLRLVQGGLECEGPADRARDGRCEGAMAMASKGGRGRVRLPYHSHATDGADDGTALFKDDGTLEGLDLDAERRGLARGGIGGSGLHLRGSRGPQGDAGRRFRPPGAPQDYVTQSVQIAKQFPGKPVKLMWSREEDMQHGFYRPASLGAHEGGPGLVGQGCSRCTRWSPVPSILALLRPEGIQKGIDFTAVRTLSDAPYQIPNQLVEYAMRNPTCRWGSGARPGLQNSFYRECFIDELAHAAARIRWSTGCR